jgi:photosystem II stability/assembly factor-like uncharacterized protein
VLRRFSAVALTVSACCATSSFSTDAFANGRFPAAGQVVVDPGDPQHIVLRATYGILQSTDGGTTWRWMCEQSVGYGGVEDPAMGIMADGRVISGIFEGLSESADRGCTWALVQDPLTDQYVIDVAIQAANPAHAVAITSTSVAGGLHVILAETNDSGASWAQSGVALDPTFQPLTVEVSSSNPDRVYVSGLFGTSNEAAIARTDNRGQSWTILPLGAQGGTGAYIGAIDPADPGRLWARVDGTDTDTLLFSKDSGQTWTTVASVPGEMLGFALSPDGQNVAIGGPNAGVLGAKASDNVFAPASSVGVRCLRWAANGLYGCASENTDGFTLGRSTDLGKTFVPLYHLADLKPLDCPAGTPTATQCPANWPAIANSIGASAAGGSGAGGGGTTKPPADSGCSVASERPRGDSVSAWLALAMMLPLFRRYKRR